MIDTPAALTPTEQELLQISEQAIAPVGQPQPSYETQDTVQAGQAEQSDLSRGELVLRLLDEAWAQGMTTYPKLIGYVRQQSGAGCSKRLVAQWKRDRGLMDEAA